MGNIIGGRKRAKVMKINGEIFKIKIPARTLEVVNDYPGHVLLESKSVERFGVRAKPLEPEELLKPKKIYFLVELPKLPQEKMRRAQSAVHRSAKDWLLPCRSVSDLSVVTPVSRGSGGAGPSSGQVRVKLRLPKAELVKMVEESRDEAEVAEKIMDLYREKAAGEVERDGSDEREGLLVRKKVQWRPALCRIRENLGPDGVSLL